MRFLEVYWDECRFLCEYFGRFRVIYREYRGDKRKRKDRDESLEVEVVLLSVVNYTFSFFFFLDDFVLFIFYNFWFILGL